MYCIITTQTINHETTYSTEIVSEDKVFELYKHHWYEINELPESFSSIRFHSLACDETFNEYFTIVKV
jgi:anthranilate/para-aminobenzoate synthase component II